MKSRKCLLQMLLSEMCIPIRRRNLGMAEHLLNDA